MLARNLFKVERRWMLKLKITVKLLNCGKLESHRQYQFNIKPIRNQRKAFNHKIISNVRENNKKFITESMTLNLISRNIFLTYKTKKYSNKRLYKV